VDGKFVKLLVRPTDLGNQQLANWVYALQGNTDPNGLGVNLGEADRAVRTQLGLPNDRGLVLLSMTPGGPAAQAGLLENDILLSLGDKPLGTPEDLKVWLKEAGDKPLALSLLRAGKPVKIEIKPVYHVSFTAVGPQQNKYYIGVPVKPVDSTLRAQLPELPEGQGLVAETILADSPAAKAGVQPDDILLSVGDKPVTDTETLIAHIQATGGKPTPVKLFRKGKPMTLEVTPGVRKEAVQGEVLADANAQFVDLATATFQLQPNAFQPFVMSQMNGNALAGWQNVAVPYIYYGNMAANVNPAQPAENAQIEKRLEAMSQEIKQLRDTIEALRQALKR
jgi:membrane-associated protease RseP (regulator of RpoE activity)